MKPPVCATVDLDPLRCYLENRGLEPAPGTSLDAVILDGLPRFLEVFAESGITATFFVVGEDLVDPRRAAILRETANRGHELANHSYSHNLRLAELEELDLTDDIRRTSRLIESTCLTECHGFRAPAWNVSARLFTVLSELDFVYDSSLVRLPVNPAMSRLLRLAAGRLAPHRLFQGQLDWPNPAPGPYRLDPRRPWRRGDSRLVEVPGGCSSAWPPVPLNHTALAMLGDTLAGTLLRIAALGPHPLVYTFHGLDLVDFHARIRDPRLGSKPGLLEPLARKLDRVRRVLDRLGRGRRWLPLIDLVRETGCSG